LYERDSWQIDGKKPPLQGHSNGQVQ